MILPLAEKLKKKIESQADLSLYPVYWGDSNKENNKIPKTFFLDGDAIAEPIGWAPDEWRANQIVRLDSEFQGYKPGKDFKHVAPKLYRVQVKNFAFSAWVGQ
jgi:hypothetical protein